MLSACAGEQKSDDISGQNEVHGSTEDSETENIEFSGTIPFEVSVCDAKVQPTGDYDSAGESQFLYATCELGSYTLSVYRDSEDQLLIRATNEQEDQVIYCYDGWSEYAFDEWEASIDSGAYEGDIAVSFSDIFQNEGCVVEVPEGAATTNYIVIELVNEIPVVTLNVWENGLSVTDVDGDGSLELASDLEGYFYYGSEDGEVFRAVFASDASVKQIALNADGSYTVLLENGESRSMAVDMEEKCLKTIE